MQLFKRREFWFITIIFIATGLTWALKAQKKPNDPPKYYSVSFTLDQWQGVLNGLESVKNAVKTSNMPANQATIISDSILVAYQVEFTRQIQSQLSAEQKLKDSTSNKAKRN